MLNSNATAMKRVVLVLILLCSLPPPLISIIEPINIRWPLLASKWIRRNTRSATNRTGSWNQDAKEMEHVDTSTGYWVDVLDSHGDTRCLNGGSGVILNVASSCNQDEQKVYHNKLAGLQRPGGLEREAEIRPDLRIETGRMWGRHEGCRGCFAKQVNISMETAVEEGHSRNLTYFFNHVNCWP